MIFLESLDSVLGDPNAVLAGGMMGAFVGLVMAFLVVILIAAVALYIYTSFAYMAIAKKARYPSPAFAWIPAVGPALIASSTAKMHWWPVLLLIGFFIPFVSWICMIAFSVFFVIWMWKTFEVIGKPGWWAIFMIIPILNLVYLILLGIAAWSK